MSLKSVIAALVVACVLLSVESRRVIERSVQLQQDRPVFQLQARTEERAPDRANPQRIEEVRSVVQRTEELAPQRVVTFAVPEEDLRQVQAQVVQRPQPLAALRELERPAPVVVNMDLWTVSN